MDKTVVLGKIDEMGRVKLYDRMLEKLSLKEGDIIFFVPDENGRWQVYTQDEVEQAMKEAWSEKNGGHNA